MDQLTEKLYELLPKIRVNCVLLVDAFDWHDSNLGKLKINIKKLLEKNLRKREMMLLIKW